MGKGEKREGSEGRGEEGVKEVKARGKKEKKRNGKGREGMEESAEMK